MRSICIFFLLIGNYLVPYLPSLAAELVSSNYQFGDLRLQYLPPENDGGEQITKYNIEWDASTNDASVPLFAPSSQYYGSAEVANVRENQEISVSCRSACTGTFLLSWGGRVTNEVSVDATSEEMESALSELLQPFNLHTDGSSPVRVTRKANGFAFKWRIAFVGISGDIGLIQANGDLLVGSGANVKVVETTKGSGDLYPGAYTNEVQTVSVRRRQGFACESLSGNFALSFEGKITAPIDIDAPSDDFKQALEALETIHSVNVESDHHNSAGPGDCASRSWLVTFTHLVHENRQGAGDIGLLRLSSSNLSDPAVTQVDVFENVKGTNPRAFNIRGLQHGLIYHCRVSAYNSFGYGVASSTVKARPKTQPSPPIGPIVSVPNVNNLDHLGKSLSVSWQAVNHDAGDPVSEYKLEWYSAVDNLEVQKLTTSAADGITDVQSIKISADTDGVTGYFTLTFKGETTELIAHDAEADGEESVEMKLERLSTIGDVEVSREYSWTSIPNVEFDLSSGSNVLSKVGGSYSGALADMFTVGDLVHIGEEVHTISSVGSSFLMTNNLYLGPSATAVNINTWSFGHVWMVTFASHIGKQPLLEASPANNWAGSNPAIEVTHVREGNEALSGSLRLGFEGERTLPIPFDADASLVKQALESLSSIGEVDVSRFRNNNGHNWFITFISELGDLELMTVDDAQLMGPDARARMATLTEGTEPTNYGSTTIQHPSQSDSLSMEYLLNGLDNGVPYFVCIRSRNSKGFGYASTAFPSPMTPIKEPSSPTSVSMFPLSDTRMRISWQTPLQDGGSSITKYAVQWDTEASFPNAWVEGYFHEEFVAVEDDSGVVYCHTLSIDPSSSDALRYARVLAFNGYKYSDSMGASIQSATAVVDKPGPVSTFNAFPTSNIGMMLTWSHPSINDKEGCGYAGDGGSPITHYVIEYDEAADFNSPATSVIVPSTSTELRVGGRDVLSGSESPILKESGTYYSRITPFNAIGPGTTETFPSAIGPLADTDPSAPIIRSAVAVSASSLQVEWDAPAFDGGSVIQEYIIEYDIDENFQSTAKNITVPPISEVKALQVESNGLELNVQTIQATVAVTNEVQSIKTEVQGVDEVQEISTTCDDVTAEVQMVVTNAIDTNEEQVISLVSDDVDEIQLIRLQGDNQAEVQSVQVSIPRVNEVQKFGVVISNINTDGDGVHSTACTGLSVGDPCSDIEDSFAGSFTVSFDFDECGSSVGGGVNYCQLALSRYEPGFGTVVCSPGLVTDPFTGGDHCVSEAVTHSYSSLEGDTGTLQQRLNDLIDDNGVSFMTSSNVPGKQEAVTVTRTGRIKTKGSCILDSVGSNPAMCTGEYEVLYEISFDAVHSSGDTPPLTVVTSDFRLDTTSSSYGSTMCPTAYYVDGCEGPTGAALDSDHGSFYSGEADSIAIESIKGSQPTGMITLDYECESIITSLPGGYFMTVSADGMSAGFNRVGFVGNIEVGQWIRFSAGDGIDHYRVITGANSVTDSVTFDIQAPVNSAIYTDVEFGDYFSDWNEIDGSSGVSSHCQGSRTHATLPIDVDVHNSALSVTDWKGKIGALSVIDSSGVGVTRNLVPDLTVDVGLVWDVTFQKQPGNVHEMSCTNSVSGTNQCIVNTLQHSSIIDGGFKLQTTWPHEYMSETPQLYETSRVRWNSKAQTLKTELESIADANGDKVFGTVDVSRTPYVPPSHSRWSGGYLWSITFLSRGGNIPALTLDDSSLVGANPLLEVSDEDSGLNDLFQGVRNNALFISDDPGLARDGNQIAGSFAFSWSGNSYHGPIATADVFTVLTGGSSSDQFMALSADAFKALFEEHVLNSVNQVNVVRSEQPTQWMGFTYTIIFRHEDVGGDVPALTYSLGSPLGGSNSHVRIDEGTKGTEFVGTFQLRYEGETTRPINHDATAQDIQEALNELNSIAPSAVTVSGGDSPIRSGPADGAGGTSTQVGGRIWYVTFASNVWQDPTVAHDSSFVPGNWVGPPASFSDVWSSGFSKAWGKNVGNVPLMRCLQNGLSTTNGAVPDDGCSVSELIPGTDPLGGAFKICLDSALNPNNVMSVESDSCTDFITHNAVASAIESGGDGSSVEEKLEQLNNIGDVRVARSAVNPRNGGYTWEVQFLYDADGPCTQKDDMISLCNAPGNVQKLCDASGATVCDTASLKGTCLKPSSCDKLTVIDASGKLNGVRFPAGNERQIVIVKDSDYLGWKDGSVVDSSSTLKDYKLLINGAATECINHNALADEMRTSIQGVLDTGIGGNVRVDRTRSENLAQNGFVYYLTFYDTGDIALITASFTDGACSNDFEASQSVMVTPMSHGALHPSVCEDCADGIVQRGDFTLWEGVGDGLSGALAWNAGPVSVKSHLEQSGDRVVDVTRIVLDKYGTIEWMITFTKNSFMTPPGSGDVDPLTISQDPDTSGRSANIAVNEIVKGSDGLAGTFNLDYGGSGPRTFSFGESPQRMLRKLEEMSTVGSVFVSRDCYPSCASGGWGGTAVLPGTIGGYEWIIHFLKNPGSAFGYSFPPGSGSAYPPAIDHALLHGEDSTVTMDSPSEGSAPLAGAFSLTINGEETESIPYNIDASAMEHTVNDLTSVGHVTVKAGAKMNHLIAGITASVVTDGAIASMTGGDLREHLAPGGAFRIGGSSDEIDGAENIGSATLAPLSPILSGVKFDNRNRINVDETIRIGGDMYSIIKNGIEVQQIAVHRSSSIPNGDFYQLKVAIQNDEETTACLEFDATASEVESALNSLPILLAKGGVFVTKTDTTGLIGDAHFYKVYFTGGQLLGDIDELVAEQCVAGVSPGVDSTNSHVHIRTLIEGGATEHQRITLASDAGTTSATPAFRLSISDSNANSWNSPCYSWGVPSLDISPSIDVDLFSSGTLSVDSVDDLGNNQFQIGATSFVEGIVLIGDYVNPGNRCPGHVLSIGDDGKSVVIESLACAAVPGDVVYIGRDIGISESMTYNSGRNPELALITLFSDEEVSESVEGLYKINVEFDGVSRSTSCLSYGASAQEIQQGIGSLFDYNEDGLIDSFDVDHITVARKGDGSPSSGYGYTYEILSQGSTSAIGSSGVLGSNAPKFSIIDIGADGGCVDYGIEEALVTSTASTTDESNIISLGPGASAVNAGARLRTSSSLVSSKVYTVGHTSNDGNTLVLTENFSGSTTTSTTTLHLISGGIPRFDTGIARQGVDEYSYDLFFTGSHWKNVPNVVVNKWADGVCGNSNSDIVDGMNRGISSKTIVDGGGMLNLDSDSYVLDRVVRQDVSGMHNLYVVPPVFTIHPETSEVQRIIVKDEDNGSIWGSGQPSYKLSFGGEYTGCLNFDANDAEIEDALNSLNSICPGLDPCVTVTRSEDSVLAPNGYVFTLYFDSSMAARKDIGDPGVGGLEADTSHLDCTAFDFAGGEKVEIATLTQGKNSAEFSTLQVPFGGSPIGRWLGESQAALPIYRVSGTFWLVRFEQSLGNVDLLLNSNTLSSNALSSVEENFFDGVNPDRITIPNVSTGIEYFSRAYSKTNNGFSPPSSDTVSSIPSDKPEKLRNVASGYAVHRNEVQSVRIAASHQKEIQSVTTSAIPISEVQEVTLLGTENSDMGTYFYSLRHPEIQVVKWSSGSPVTAGSFFLKLQYVDRINSEISGSIIYKELKTPCINFDATADDIKRAMEADAVLNGLGANSVRVTRSGNRSFSSDYGYSYKIHFVGGDVRGNVLELTSDLALTGMDSNGSNSCAAFVSSTNDASLDIWTENGSLALGTDTPRAEILVDANIPIVDGEFQLSVTHYGQQLTTGCIPWDGTAEEVKLALESLNNVDSVRVDRFGEGMLSDMQQLSISGYSFQHNGGSSFLASTSDGLSNVLFEGDVIKLSTQADSSAFYKIVSLSGGTMVLDKPFVGDALVSSYVTRYFGIRYIIYFDGNAMHTDGTESSGFMPQFGSNFIVTEPNSCRPLQAYHNNVLKQVSEIPDSIAHVRAVSKYDGKHTLPGEPTSASSLEISSTLTSSLPMSVSEAHVTHSLETSQSGLTLTITYGNGDGDVPLLVCNQSPSLTSLSECGTNTVIDGNEIRGNFYLLSSDPIPYNANPSIVESALRGVSGIGQVEVSRSQPDGQLGYTWLVTFSDDHGDVPILQASNSLTGKGAALTVEEVTKGNQLGGFFTLSFGPDATDEMPFDVDKGALHLALESLNEIGHVDVNTDGQVDSELGRSFTVTFLDSDLGDAPLLVADAEQLTGLGKAVHVSENIKGSLAVKDALHVSFDLPRSCSTSDVGRAHCGVPITEASIEFSATMDFSGAITSSHYSLDYSTQFIRTSYMGDSPPQQLSGYFNVAHGESLSTPINANASADDVRVALEALLDIETVSVERDYASYVASSVCIEIVTGSALVQCSASCSPCDFGNIGIIANQLIKVGDKWRRVSSSYDGVQESFIIATVEDSSVKAPYVGEINLFERELLVWTGGYEWAVFLHNVAGDVKPFSTPVHSMLPREAAVEIGAKDCDKCMYTNTLSPGTQYYVRGRVKNSRGWSEYSDVISETPRAIPSAPTYVHVNAISGECLEVEFSPPVYGEPLTSYVVQWDYSVDYGTLDDLASCISLRYGSCVLPQPGGPPPIKHEICGLLESEEYHVRVAATNSVQVQSVYPSGNPKDNTNWSGSTLAVPLDQVPDPPTSLEVRVLMHDQLQVSFDWPKRDGGKEITEFVVSYDMIEDFSTSNEMIIPPSLPEKIPSSSDKFMFDFAPTNPPLSAGTTYFIKLNAINEVGTSVASTIATAIPSGPPAPPSAAVLTTLHISALPVTEATVSWTPPLSDGGYPTDGYFVEWWSQDTRPEVQVVRLLYTSLLSQTTFTLSLSPTPTIKKETSNLPWDASADLVRREILNLGWDENEDLVVVSDVKVTRSTLANGYQWVITFGDNPDRSLNDGDQVSLSGSVIQNGDTGSPTITVSTSQDGQRPGGLNEIQFLQIIGTGTLSGHYRIKFSSSEWTSFISIHASASSIKNALEQLSTVGEVDVVQNDGVDQSLAGTDGDLVHHYEIQFLSNPGNVEAMVIDTLHLESSDDDVSAIIFDGSNSMDSLNTKESAATPGELPMHYGNSGILDSTIDIFRITGLITGTEYFVTVSARNSVHGLSKRMLPQPSSITPPLQAPGIPQHVTLDVNTGYSDSLVVNFDPPASNGGNDILFYRVELDPTASFDSPIMERFDCAANNKRTEWEIETSADGGGVINGGSFRLELEVDGFTSLTAEIPHDAVALASNETGISEELILPNFSTAANSNGISTIPPIDIEQVLFPGDRLRFSGQSATYKYYEVQSVSGTSAVLSEPFIGDDGVQVSTTRHHGGRGSPLSSRIHCQYQEDLCPVASESKSGSLQSKLEDMSLAIQNGVFVDRDGPNSQNGFIWRVTFMDDAYPQGSDFTFQVHSNSLTTFGNQGSAHVSVSLLNSGKTYSACAGSLVMPSLGGLVKGLEYHGRVSARNSEGYSLPVQAPEPVAPMVIPGAPTGVTLDVVSATELRVIFGSPSDNGGDSITQYLIEWSTSSDFAITQSSTLDYLAGGSPFFKNIGGLTTGTFYFVRVRAKNSQGYGISQMTTPASLNPHQKPSPPTNIKLGITSNTMLTIGWGPPLSDGGDTVSKYRVEWDTKSSFASSSYPPNKGYIDVDSSVTSHTIQLLSSQKSYYFRVQAMNTSGSSSPQLATPSWATPSLQVPGSPHSVQAVPGSSAGTIEISWQRPMRPHHSISCFNEGATVKECPTPYGGSLPASNGGDDISEYELEYNERADFLGSDGGSKTYTGFHAVLSHLYSGRAYFVRVLARNSIGSGKYGEIVSVQAT